MEQQEVRPYEMVALLDPGLSSPDMEATLQRIRETLEKHGAEVEEVKEWGRRTLAYPIRKKNEAFYMIFHFKAPPPLPVEVRWPLSRIQGLLRFLIVRREEDHG